MKSSKVFNNISEDLKNKIPKLKPGEVVTFQMLNGTPNPDPDPREQQKEPVIYGKRQLLTSFRIYDKGKGEYVDVGAVETWNILKAWYDLVWNSQNGYAHYKADCIGTCIVNQHDKKGLVIRRVTFQNVQIYGIDGTSLDWASTDSILEGSAKFRADYWIDEYIDNDFNLHKALPLAVILQHSISAVLKRPLDYF